MNFASLIYLFGLLSALSARADHRLSVRDGARGEITLEVTGNDVVAHPHPTREPFRSRSNRSRRRFVKIPLVRHARIRDELTPRVFAPLRPEELFSIGDRHFAVVREIRGALERPFYLAEFKVGFGRKLLPRDYAASFGILVLLPFILFNPAGDLTAPERIAAGTVVMGLATFYGLRSLRDLARVHGAGWLSERDREFIRVNEVVRDGTRVEDVLVAPASARAIDPGESLRALLQGGCEVIFTSTPNPT